MTITQQLYRLKLGVHTALDLMNDASSLIRDWPTTRTSGGWLILPGASASDPAKYITRRYSTREMTLAGTMAMQGLPHDGFRIARMDDTDWAHLLTVLPGEDTIVTVLLPDRQKPGGAGWTAWVGRCYRPAYSELKTRDGIWYVETPLTFAMLEAAAPGDEEEDDEEEEDTEGGDE